jgi:hypothetical protein
VLELSGASHQECVDCANHLCGEEGVAPSSAPSSDWIQGVVLVCVVLVAVAIGCASVSLAMGRKSKRIGAMDTGGLATEKSADYLANPAATIADPPGAPPADYGTWR